MCLIVVFPSPPPTSPARSLSQPGGALRDPSQGRGSAEASKSPFFLWFFSTLPYRLSPRGGGQAAPPPPATQRPPPLSGHQGGDSEDEEEEGGSECPAVRG